MIMLFPASAELLPGYMPDGTEAGAVIDESMVPQAAYEINADLCPYGEQLLV